MITNHEISLIEENSNYQIIRITGNYIEFRSRNTWHCWIIALDNVSQMYPYSIYHKHKLSHDYHRHWQSYSFEKCLKSIQDHDDYVLKVNPVINKYVMNDRLKKTKRCRYC